MRIHADFSLPALVFPAQQQWVPSPQAGVERVMLDRIGEEKARATSLVRYAPNSFFPAHEHPEGEEFLVLAGVFCEGDLRHGAGSYLRNPPGSKHQPFTDEGALLFVKLRQMQPTEQETLAVATTNAENWQQEGKIRRCPLFADAHERVELIELAAHSSWHLTLAKGAELLILQGELIAEAQDLPSQVFSTVRFPDQPITRQTFPCQTWARFPRGPDMQVSAGANGVQFYLKTGHLA